MKEGRKRLLSLISENKEEKEGKDFNLKRKRKAFSSFSRTWECIKEGRRMKE